MCGNPVDDRRAAYCSAKCRQVAYGAIGEYNWSSIRKRVLRRYGRSCVACGASAEEADIEVDHIVPLSRGGAAHDERNLQPLCKSCHREKGLDATDHRPDADHSDAGVRGMEGTRERVLAAKNPSEADTPAATRVLAPGRFVIETDADPPTERQRERDTRSAGSAEREDPEPPDGLPEYLTDPVSRQDLDALRELQTWVENRIEYLDWESVKPLRAERVLAFTDAEDIGDVIESAGGWLYTKHLPCGPGCDGCPHGPYTYRYYRGRDGSLTSEYVGAGPAEEYASDG